MFLHVLEIFIAPTIQNLRKSSFFGRLGNTCVVTKQPEVEHDHPYPEGDKLRVNVGAGNFGGPVQVETFFGKVKYMWKC